MVHTLEAELPCLVKDLSRTGVRLSGVFPEPLDRVLDLTLAGSLGALAARVRARTARSTPASEAAFEFLDLTPDQIRAIRTLLDGGVLRPASPAAPLEAIRPSASVAEVRAALEAIPLPRRIGLAARASRKERDAIRQDTHPAVLGALSRNPEITLAEARVLATSPHLTAATLESLACDPRWSKDEALLLAVADHPRVAAPLADRIVADFGADQCRRLLRRPKLGARTRERLSRRVVRGH